VKASCDHCRRPGHSRDNCFDLHPELRSGKGRGAASTPSAGGKAGKGGKGGGAPTVSGGSAVTTPTPSADAMAARIEQLEQRLASMASGSASYGDDGYGFGGMAEVSEVKEEAAVVTRAASRVAEPRGAAAELDPQRGEASRQVRLPQSFLLSEAIRTPSMAPTRPQEPSVRAQPSSSQGSDAERDTSRVSEVAGTVMEAPLFSAKELMALGIDASSIFRRAAALCARTQGTAMGAGVKEEVVVDQPSTSATKVSGDGAWQAVAAKMEDLPARPMVDRASFNPGVCMLDNQSGVFQLRGPRGQVYVPERVLLDSGAQPLMLGKKAVLGLGMKQADLRPCPFKIQTSLGGLGDAHPFLTWERLSVEVMPGHATNNSNVRVTAVATQAQSYDVLVGGAVLYPMGFQMDYWSETASFRPGWRDGDGRTCMLPVKFLAGPKAGGTVPGVTAIIGGFSGIIDGPDELLEGNRSAEDTPVYEELEEVTASMNAVLDAPWWGTVQELRRDADRLVASAWREAFIPEEEDDSARDLEDRVGRSRLNTTTILWQYPDEGVCVLDLFGGMSTGLAAVLQAGLRVRRYAYVERDETARRVSLHHISGLLRRYPDLLPRSAVQGYQRSLPADIMLLGAQDLDRIGPIDLVIAGWPCQGHTRAGRGQGLDDPRSRMFWEMLQVLRYLQDHQVRPPAFILENVSLMGDTRPSVISAAMAVRTGLGRAVPLDAARVGSRAHRPRLWWTNLLPREVLRRSFEKIRRPPTLTVDTILDPGRRSQVVRVADIPPIAVVNLVGRPRMALPTLMSFPGSYAFRDGGPGMVWDSSTQRLEEPNADERERAMGFPTGVTAAPSVSELSRRQVLGQAMDLNCLTWVLSLGLAEQRRLRTAERLIEPLVMSSLQTETVDATAGGAEQRRVHPWSTWDVLGESVESMTTDFSHVEVESEDSAPPPEGVA
jgi:hypothetical protein